MDRAKPFDRIFDALSFEERVGLLVDREAAERDTKRLTGCGTDN